MISTLPGNLLKKAIAFEDVSAISKANGIGKKTAQRVILELKDKIGDISLFEASDEKPGKAAKTSAAREMAIQGLTALGYSRAEAASAVAAVEDDGLTTEQYIRQALRQKNN